MLTIFSFRGRIGRLRFFLTQLAVYVLQGGVVASTGSELVQSAVALLFLWVMLASYVARLHDLGKSAWSLLWFLVPFVNLFYYFYLLLAGGQPHPNRYGSPR